MANAVSPFEKHQISAALKRLIPMIYLQELLWPALDSFHLIEANSAIKVGYSLCCLYEHRCSVWGQNRTFNSLEHIPKLSLTELSLLSPFH